MTLEILLEGGTDIDATDSEGKTALHIAAIRGDANSARVLLEHRADTEVRSIPSGLKHMRRHSGGRTPMHWATFEGREDVVRLLLSHGANASSKSCLSRTPLQEAAMMQHLAIVKLLVEGGASVIAQDDQGYTPLHESVLGNRLDIVEYLLDNGAQPNVQSTGRARAASPLTLAIKQGSEDMARLLLSRGASTHDTDSMNMTVLHAAVWKHDSKSLTQILLNAGAYIDAKDSIGETPLHKAGRKGHLSALQTLLAYSPNLEACNDHGNTAAQEAAISRKFEATELITRFGINGGFSGTKV